MDEGQKRGEENVVHHSLFVYTEPGNKKSQRIPFNKYPNKTSLYQSRVAAMKRNFKMTPLKRPVIRMAPKPIQQPIKIEAKKLEHNAVCKATNACFDDKLMFPDDLELSFCSGQLDTSRQLENAITSTVPDVDTGNHDDTAESQDFYQLPTSSKPNRKSRKRTYRDFPNYTNKKPYYGGKS